MNKLITYVLDNYYTEKFIKSLEADLSKNNVLFKVNSNHGCIDIYLKPTLCSNYKFICSFKKSDALECLIRDRTKFMAFIKQAIKKLGGI